MSKSNEFSDTSGAGLVTEVKAVGLPESPPAAVDSQTETQETTPAATALTATEASPAPSGELAAPLTGSELYQKLEPGAQAVCRQMLALVIQGNKNAVLIEYEIGRLSLELSEKEDDQGKTDLDKVADCLGLKATKLYNLRRFAKTYTRPQVQTLLDRTTQKGKAIGISAFSVLATIDDEGFRHQLEEDYFQQDLTIADLKKRLSEKLHAARVDAGPLPPVSTVAILKTLSKDTKPFVAKASSYHDLFARLDRFRLGDIDKDTQAALDEARDQLAKLKALADEGVQRLSNASERINAADALLSGSSEDTNGQPESTGNQGPPDVSADGADASLFGDANVAAPTDEAGTDNG